MKPIDFPEASIVLAKDQPEYQQLPVFLSADGEEMISCWRLSLKERVILLITGRIWIRQLVFGQRLQPQLPEIYDPFI